MEYQTRNEKFCLNDYDCIGFDYDHTIIKYNLTAFNTMLYDCFAQSLIDQFGHNNNIYKGRGNVEFIQRGLFIDIDRGNFLKVGKNGEILKASHGTKMLNMGTIQNIYGQFPTWPKALEFLKVPKGVSYKAGNLCFTDFYSSPFYLLMARLVDQYDEQDRRYTFWDDVLKVFGTAFSIESMGISPYAVKMRQNFTKYADMRSVDKVSSWLHGLKNSGKTVFLLTAAPPSFSTWANSSYLGKNWRDHYHVAVNGFKKPSVFSSSNKTPFVPSSTVDNIDFSRITTSAPLEVGGLYSGGNYSELYEFLQKRTGKSNPRVVYFGDDFLNDIYGSGHYAKNCETVGIIEEMASDYNGDGRFNKPQIFGKDSQVWGNLFYDTDVNGRRIETLWGNVVTKNTKMLVPSLECFAGMPINHKYQYPCVTKNDKISSFNAVSNQGVGGQQTKIY